MSVTKILEFGVESRFGNMSFPDLETRFERHLAQIRSIADLDYLLSTLKPLFQDKRYSSDEILRLKRLRQRAYDRRRNPKFQILVSDRLTKTKSKKDIDVVSQTEAGPQAGANMPSVLNIESAKGTFADGALRSVGTNSEYWLKVLPPLLAWLSAAALVSFFLWQQSLALYESAGFTNPIYSAAGGILMIVGFAAYHSITRSWLALLFCIYAGAYEGYLMVSGTINDENHTQAKGIQNDEELVFLAEKAGKERDRYHELKERYDNPESKVFKNDWFLKNHLNPAWDASLKAHEQLVAKKTTLMVISATTHVTYLKIFYRLGLVFLCMILVHRFFTSCALKN